MVVSLFKPLSAVNSALALLNLESFARHPALQNCRDDAQRLFDRREICLRVIAKCREELDRPVDDES